MATYEVSVEDSFNAEHAIRLPDGTLEKPHQHRWCVTVTFRSDELDENTGIVVDFLEILEALRSITDKLEGADLNALDDLRGTSASAERVAEMLARRLSIKIGGPAKLHRVSVTEGTGCSAAYYPQGGRA